MRKRVALVAMMVFSRDACRGQVRDMTATVPRQSGTVWDFDWDNTNLTVNRVWLSEFQKVKLDFVPTTKSNEISLRQSKSMTFDRDFDRDHSRTHIHTRCFRAIIFDVDWRGHQCDATLSSDVPDTWSCSLVPLLCNWFFDVEQCALSYCRLKSMGYCLWYNC